MACRLEGAEGPCGAGLVGRYPWESIAGGTGCALCVNVPLLPKAASHNAERTSVLYIGHRLAHAALSLWHLHPFPPPQQNFPDFVT